MSMYYVHVHGGTCAMYAICMTRVVKRGKAWLSCGENGEYGTLDKQGN